MVSFGGGVQSTALLVLAARGEIDFPIFLFCNVGEDSENPATLEYVEEYTRPYAEENGIVFEELRKVRRSGGTETLFENLHRTERTINIPVRMANGAPGNRNCTETFKIKVVARWLREHGATEANKATVALGISTDEFQRMRTHSGFKYYDLSYPLFDRKIDRATCLKIVADAGLPEPPKSSCYFCPFKRIGEWKTMAQEKPDLFGKAVLLEKFLNEKRQRLGRDDIFLSSAKKPLDQLADPQSLPVNQHEDDTCESGYCMT